MKWSGKFKESFQAFTVYMCGRMKMQGLNSDPVEVLARSRNLERWAWDLAQQLRSLGMGPASGADIKSAECNRCVSIFADILVVRIGSRSARESRRSVWQSARVAIRRRRSIRARCGLMASMWRRLDVPPDRGRADCKTNQRPEQRWPRRRYTQACNRDER